ncbi:asparagine synthase (glutamine-hydrolyzing) [Desulfospira joergensenii]|uniref:asparagine synthase (glutamine-hydrolyzing) n=1 Tax=Desulfospira joergensenii TaxID=53329 RepID=UPI00047F45A8|nr:asparagine synthase (glutamine-hydrolyzing) [Desulfospira joergensenii]
MCGIAGMFHRSGDCVDIDHLVSMTRTLAHRGPDEEGYFINADQDEGTSRQDIPLHHLCIKRNQRLREGMTGNVGLGHRRLSIIDLATGQQPLCNEDGSIWIVFNGEIYNFQDLKDELVKIGHQFKTNSDTETIVHGYEQWGEKIIEKLRGMFSFAIWDQNRQKLLLARDRLGKKPLYFFEDKNRLIFGSEIKAILELSNVERQVDETALSDYLSLLYVPSPKSIFKNIHKLPAAHYAVVSKENIQVRPYWDLSFFPEHEYTENQMMDEMISILEDATRMRMISEVPLGAFLSGGVDSSAVVAMMSGFSDTPVKTNSISFSVAKYNEIDYARKIAGLFETDHNEFHVNPDALSVIEKLAWHYDEPFADSSSVPTYYVSQMARKNVTVSLSGDGGDENFAGYRRYYFDMRENFIRNIVPGPLRKYVFGGVGRLYPKADFLPQIFRGKAFISNVARDPVDAYFFSMSGFHEEEKGHLINDDFKKSLGGYDTKTLFHDLYRTAPARDHLSKIQYLDIKTYLCEDILTKVDRASMAVSLEVRCPILDHVFMEYVAKIPSKMKLVGTDGKHIFKKALKSKVPEKILYRKKMGFGVPILEWLRSDLKEYSRSLVLEGRASKTYLDSKYLNTIWGEHQKGLRNRATELWTVMMLNLWYENYM